MIVCRNKSDLEIEISKLKYEKKTIGFIPTMGYLHSGHISLMERSKETCDASVVSIFVNPLQFNDPKDLENYPVDEKGDLEKCEKAGVHLVFLPSPEDIYSNSDFPILMRMESLQKNLCGRTRPGHFEGVLVIVLKLFNLVKPDYAFFGKKDFQQFRIIQEMTKTLSLSVTVLGLETKRESDGLAMSSRNAKLNTKEREAASLIPRMYQLADKIIREGNRNLNEIKIILSEFLLTSPLLKIDYIEIVDPISLEIKTEAIGEIVIAIAVFSGNIRLIDNKEFSFR